MQFLNAETTVRKLVPLPPGKLHPQVINSKRSLNNPLFLAPANWLLIIVHPSGLPIFTSYSRAKSVCPYCPVLSHWSQDMSPVERAFLAVHYVY